MATYRKPLKDIDGNTIIPAMTGDQTGWVQTGDLANGAVTANKIASSLYNDIVLAPGTYHVEFTLGARTGNSSHQNFVYYTTGISRVIQPGSSISFVPVEAYGIEIFGPNGVLFSKSNGTSSVATTSIGMDDISNLVFTTYINTSEVTLPTNTSVSIKINGNLTIS